MLAWLRAMALMEVEEETEGPMMRTLGSIHGVDVLMEALSDARLKQLAPLIPLETARR